MKKLIALLLAACLMLGLMTTAFAADEKSNDIVILYTNDVHCAVDDNIGYAGLAAYKKEMQAAYNYVALVDCGDSVQGDVIGTLSKGEYLVDIMNEVGYDFASFGNHEFDYTLPQLQKLIDKAKYQYLCCNLTYTGKDGKGLTGYKAYEIKTYGDIKVAFVGIDTPESFTKSTPTYFQDANGNFVYSFAEGNKGADLYNKVQETVDAAKKDGATYVVALAHLGVDESSEPWRSTDLIANTTGIDVVLDGNWAVEAVNYVTDKNFMKGLSETTFGPNGALTRGMLVTVLYRMAGSPEVTGKVSEKFTDCTDGSWYADAVLWASANKIVDGYEDGTYKPTKAISRQEMAKVLYGYDKIGGKTADGITEKLTYTDVDAIGEWALESVTYCTAAGYLAGSNGAFNPKGTATRAMGAKVLMNMTKEAA